MHDSSNSSGRTVEDEEMKAAIRSCVLPPAVSEHPFFDDAGVALFFMVVEKNNRQGAA